MNPIVNYRSTSLPAIDIARLIYFIHGSHRIKLLIIKEEIPRLRTLLNQPSNFDFCRKEVLMKSINPVSQPSGQSNIVPFNSEQFASKRLSTQSNLDCKQNSFWTHFWNGLCNFLMPRSEPKIIQKIEPDGNEYYQVYDPVTGNSKTFGSELETRIWLDRRFYQ